MAQVEWCYSHMKKKRRKLEEEEKEQKEVRGWDPLYLYLVQRLLEPDIAAKKEMGVICATARTLKNQIFHWYILHLYETQRAVPKEKLDQNWFISLIHCRCLQLRDGGEVTRYEIEKLFAPVAPIEFSKRAKDDATSGIYREWYHFFRSYDVSVHCFNVQNASAWRASWQARKHNRWLKMASFCGGDRRK